MDKNSWKTIEKIYDEALALGATERSNFVKNKTKGDKELFEQVMKMLDATNSHDFMNDFPGQMNPNKLSLPQPEYLGHFKILKKIATGGMGRVYLGQSTTADVDIKVALKTIRIELISKDLKGKFQNEKNILSQLRHKNIASLIDAGISDNNIPYIATEWVEGINIADYCIEHNLSIRQRLKLFLQVCDAMTFAHNKMIIHRDLKPDNILVNNHKQVKLLDFGIAKIVDANQGSVTQTQIFTPDYAAPEQLNGEICTASTDIYSLGIILFEILTNSKRFNISDSSIAEKIKTIETPTKINLFDVKPQNPLPYSSSKLKGALCNIINKAMHVEPSRRYGSVLSLMEDLENYLAKRPIKAMKDSFFYHFKMSVVRNKLASSFMLLSFIAVISGIIISSGFLRQKLIEAEKSEVMLDFFQGILQTASPKQGGSTNISVKEMFTKGIEEYNLEKIQDLYIKAEITAQIGMIYTQLDDRKKGIEYLTKAIKYFKHNLSIKDNTYKYIKYIQELIKIHLLNQNYNKAQKILNQVESEVDLSLNKIQYLAWNHYFLGIIYHQKNEDESFSHFDIAKNLAKKNNMFLLLGKIARKRYSLFFNRLSSLESLNLLNNAQNNFEESEAKASQVNLLYTMIAKANLLSTMGKFNQSEATFAKTHKKQMSLYGFEDVTILFLRAKNLMRLGKFKTALQYLSKAETLFLQTSPNKTQRYYEIILVKASALIEFGEFSLAEENIKTGVEYFRTKLSPDHIYFKLINVIQIDLFIKSENIKAMRTIINKKWDMEKISWFNQLNLANIYLYFGDFQNAHNLYMSIVVNASEDEKVGMLYLQSKTGLELTKFKLGKLQTPKTFEQTKIQLLKSANPSEWYDKFYSIK